MRRPGLVAAVLALVALAPRSAGALSADEAREQATSSLVDVERKLKAVESSAVRAMLRDRSPAKLIAAGELALRSGDYERAIDVLNMVVELADQGKVGPSAHGTAVFLLAEGYFLEGQLLAAARHYRVVVERAGERTHARFAGRSLARLVDISYRTGHEDVLDFVFDEMEGITRDDGLGSVAYAKAKAHLARGNLTPALTEIERVPSGAGFYHQAQYLRGVVLLKQATAGDGVDVGAPEGAESVRKGRRFGPVIEQFQRVTGLSPDSVEHREVIDLAWMAIARLLYESDDYTDAARAYAQIQRTSSQFHRMLYELAWVYIRIGDYQRAQRALEVLSIAAPETLEVADGPLLRADLMLRSGQFDNALKLYRTVRSRFDPVRADVDALLRRTTDPAVYHDRLVRETASEVDEGDGLPSLVTRWVREAAEDDRVFAIIDDIGRSRKLVKRSRRIVSRLSSVLRSSTRSQAFPELREQLQDVLALVNAIAIARLALVHGLEDESDSVSAEIAAVRQEREKLDDRVSRLPTADGEFARRNERGQRRWNEVSQQLQRLELESDRLEAIVNGLRHVLHDSTGFGVTKDPAARARFEAEIEANERELEAFRKRIASYQEAVEAGRVQVGFGDESFIADARARRRFNDLVHEDFRYSAGGAAGEGGTQFATSVAPLLQRLDAAERRLLSLAQKLEGQVGLRAQDLAKVVEVEAANIDRYSVQLDALDQQGRLLVGQVAMQNFVAVRDRLAGIVLKADVGIVQQAWEIREEQRARVRILQRERAHEERLLDDELREVLDDNSGGL